MSAMENKKQYKIKTNALNSTLLLPESVQYLNLVDGLTSSIRLKIGNERIITNTTNHRHRISFNSTVREYVERKGSVPWQMPKCSTYFFMARRKILLNTSVPAKLTSEPIVDRFFTIPLVYSLNCASS